MNSACGSISGIDVSTLCCRSRLIIRRVADPAGCVLSRLTPLAAAACVMLRPPRGGVGNDTMQGARLEVVVSGQ